MSEETPLTINGILEGRKIGFFSDVGLTKLNLILALSLLSSYATGYDGSMMSEIIFDPPK